MFCCCVAPNRDEVEITSAVVFAPSLDEVGDTPTPDKAIAPSWHRFECTVERQSGEWGMTCDQWEDCFQLVKLEAGRIQDYNDSATHEQMLLVDDFILEVNDKPVSRNMFRSMRSMKTMKLKIVRPMRIDVKVIRNCGESWGLNVTFQQKQSSCVRIGSIKDGAAQQHNLSAHPSAKLEVKDFIANINGKSGAPDDMLDLCKSTDVLNLSLLRLPAESEKVDDISGCRVSATKAES